MVKRLVLRMTWHIEKYLTAKERRKRMPMVYHNAWADVYLWMLKWFVKPGGR